MVLRGSIGAVSPPLMVADEGMVLDGGSQDVGDCKGLNGELEQVLQAQSKVQPISQQFPWLRRPARVFMCDLLDLSSRNSEFECFGVALHAEERGTFCSV